MSMDMAERRGFPSRAGTARTRNAVPKPLSRAIYRDAAHPSRLVLPFTAGPATA